MSNSKLPGSYHERSVFGGFVWGALLTAVITLLWGPRFPWQSIKQAEETMRRQFDEAVNSDPVNDGIQQGKDAARQIMKDDMYN